MEEQKKIHFTKPTKQQVVTSLLQYSFVIGLGALMAITYIMFVFPNNFAPSGVSGIATMIQKVWDFKVAWFTIIVNVPLAVITFFIISKQFAIRSSVFVISFSIFLFVFDKIPNMYHYVATDAGETLLAGLASGVIVGFVYGIVLKANASTGGVDFIASLVQKTRPDISLTWFIFGLNVLIAIVSFFVYHDMSAVLLCIAHCFVVQEIADRIVIGSRKAIKFEIVTTHPEEISREIIEKLHHTATLSKGTGMYSHLEKEILTCVINKKQIVDMENILKKYPETFAYVVPVNDTIGFFRRHN